METTIELVGTLITLPFMALEAVIKSIMYILYFPIVLSIAIIYPIIKIKKWNLDWVKKWYKYSTKWKKGFYAGHIFNLWRIEE